VVSVIGHVPILTGSGEPQLAERNMVRLAQMNCPTREQPSSGKQKPNRRGYRLEITEFTPLSFASNETDVMVVTRWAATAQAPGKSAAMDIHR
jgi:hypothetical protein